MAQSSIINKLRRELNLPVRSERQVVYILAEIRKYIEHESGEARGRLAFLNFFCNWALHIEIYRDPLNIRQVLERFDVEGMSSEEYERSRFKYELRTLEVFRAELKRFLSPELPTILVDDDIEWKRFLFLYLLVVSEVPLQYTRDDLRPSDVIFLKLLYDPQPRRVAHFAWEVKLKSGEDFGIGEDYDFDELHERISHIFDCLEF
jgi:hypothetical protein